MIEVGGQVHRKPCSSCKKDLPADSFNRQKSNRDGLAYHCRECAKAKLDAWKAQNRDRRLAYYKSYKLNETDEQREKRYAHQRAVYHANPMAHRDGYLQRTYGINQAGYDEMLRAQGGRCSICASADPGGDRRFFAVDHNHKCCPGKRSCGKCIRGLLCMNCNQGLGKFGDDVNLMARAIAYVTQEVTMPTRENKDGSVTTWAEGDEEPTGAESKTVEAPKKQVVKTQSAAESK